MSKSPPPSSKFGALHQIAALPWRETSDRVEVCLVTTRATHRWTVPKGWPMRGRSDTAAARLEAQQEAGVTGKVSDEPVGSFVYWKRREARFDVVRVEVYPLKVTKILPKWKEQAERQVRWMSIEDATLMVDEPELATLLKQFDAKRQ